ncbi:MAG: hypothetical protein Q4C95_10965 [Planctomycetia bacterium]|nr:hypothetical protein [Planctomycetia bacterium]
MALGYEFLCDCGKKHRIEVSQAGQTIRCECEKSIKIPSMLKIKKMPLWLDEDKETKTESTTTTKATLQKDPSLIGNNKNEANNLRKQPVLKGNRLGVFIIGVVLFITSLFFFCCAFQRKPLPIDVFGKQTSFASGDNVIFRNSSPVSESDYKFFLYYDQPTQMTYIIGDNVLSAMSPYDAYLYFYTLSNGLDLSENFYDNFAEVKNMYRIRVVFFGILLLISFVICFIPWFMPRKNIVVGNIRGSEWKV